MLNQWDGGFQAEVVVTNTSGATISGWELAWSFPAGQPLTQLWNDRWQQSNPAPGAFTLNQLGCEVT